ncbi:hybrid sensor histidine kinase/response regulator [Brasilonema octagenarum UFV-E1]|uniref:histidine kinase n=1 Tax=Brasilonema sennae CENA114 TaxID=415709 RepID=A0A856MMB7_9CYAN|nr:PAS domain S-box protein [Brasilonema sennae]QDL11244.1 hybrid sensor histidine kinase/response regulator [Brasilonema sennae CENA114]QDL17589.1 hybrid sensor histidine kinase/response regulator [Brasilonema octagenarum UFV-E1]
MKDEEKTIEELIEELSALRQKLSQLEQVAVQQQQAQEELQQQRECSRRQVQKEQALNRVIQSIRNSLELERIFSTAAYEITQLVSADRVEIVQYIPEQQLWLNVGDYRRTPDLPSALGVEIPDADNEVAAQLKRLEVVIIEDASTCSDQVNRSLAETYRGAWLLVPVHFGSTIWGSVSLIRNNHSLSWQQEEVELTCAVADQLAIAIHQSTLLLQLQTELSEPKKAIIALQESEERFRTMADIAPVMIWMVGTDKLCNYFNRVWLEFTGRTLEQELGYGWAELLHPDDLQLCLEIYTTAFDARRSFTMEHRFRRFDGEYRWFLNTGTPRFHSDGSFAGYIGSSIDITEQKQMLEALQDSEARLRLTLDAAHMVIWDWNILTNNIVYDNSMLPLCGLSLGLNEHTFEAFLDAVYFEDRDRVVAAITDAIENKKEHEVEFRFVSLDRALRWIGDKGQVYYDQTGKPVRMVGVGIDITQRKEAEHKIREQAAWLDVATDAIIVRNLENKIVFWNKSAERLYGWKAKDVLGKNANDILYKKISSQLKEALSQVNLTGEWYGELSQIRKDGKELIVETRWTLVRDEHGNPKSILSVKTDITEKKRLQTQFLRAQRLESLGTLASGIAHDLNNTLAPMLMSAQLLRMRISDERNQQLLQTLETNAQRGAAMVKQVLSFARGVEGKRTILQIKHLISEIEQFAKQTFPKSIEFCTDIAPNLWTISGDATQLHQVLMNLVINARDAMPKGGVLSIYGENFFVDENYARMNLDATVGPHIVITVKDTGMGMLPEVLDRIFEPFFTTKEVGKGSGLGLSTVLGIIKSHNGFISVSSKIGKGTQFKVFLKAVLENQTFSEESFELPMGNGELILVVDDEAEIREITKITLENYNYKILTACDGIEALALYAQNPENIKVVFVDMMMPDMDGLTTIRALLRINPCIKIMAASGLTDNNKLIENLDVEIFLSKPYNVKQLLQALHQILN